jgi:hypothetical protein
VGRNAAGRDGAGSGESDWWGVGSGACRGRIVGVLLQHSLNTVQSPGATEQAAQGADAKVDLEAQSENAGPRFFDHFAAWWRAVQQYWSKLDKPHHGTHLAALAIAVWWSATHGGDVSSGFAIAMFIVMWFCPGK